MKYLKYSLIIVFTLIILTGCKEDFLDLKPIAKDTTESYYKSFAAVDATLTAAYGELNAREVFDKDYLLVIGSIPADDVEAGGESIADYPMAQHFDQFSHTLADDTPLEEVFQYCYKGIRFANTALERFPIIAEIDSTVSQSLINRRIGEAKFLRAWYHFTLLQIFGGVPIADKIIQPSDFNTPRNEIKEVFSFIEKDLKDAISKLPEKSVVTSTNNGHDLQFARDGRATKGAAQALLSRSLLFESSYAANYPNDERFEGCELRWSESLEYAEAVIVSDKYKLIEGLGYNSWRDSNGIDGYRWLFTADADNCDESIFEIQSVNDAGTWGETHGNVVTVFQTVRKYTTATGVAGDVGGWSFNCPTKYLIDAFKNEDSRESGLNSQPTSDETLDPRFSTTVGRDGDSILLFMSDSKSIELVPMNFSNLPTGTIGRKFECGYDEYWGISDVWSGPFNVRLIRLAEVILNAAEAAYMSNNTARALELVNMIRTRARNCGTTNYPQDLSAISFEDIMHERRLELACEPFRFFDLVRWGIAEDFISGITLEAIPSLSVEFEPGKHEFFPIPLSEIELSKGGLINYEPWQ